MNNLGGHDLPSLLELSTTLDHDRPTCFICYTVKGFGLPFAGHKDNHAGLMTPAQMETFRAGDGMFAPATNGTPSKACDAAGTSCRVSRRVPFAAAGARRLKAPQIEVPAELRARRSRP